MTENTDHILCRIADALEKLVEGFNNHTNPTGIGPTAPPTTRTHPNNPLADDGQHHCRCCNILIFWDEPGVCASCIDEVEEAKKYEK